jgi:hypothetical protein
MVGSDHDLNLNQFTHPNTIAERQFEVVIGADWVVRINVDGQCVLRLWLKPGAQVDVRNDLFQTYATSLDHTSYRDKADEKSS